MLHYFRRQVRLSQRKLAIAVGNSESMISLLEHDDRAPDIVTIFFWSKEHARAFRRAVGQPRGLYLALPQAMLLTRLAQSAIFAFLRNE